MSLVFSAESHLVPELFNESEALAPFNPFFSAAYSRARSLLGAQPWVLTLRNHGVLVLACPTFLHSGRLNVRLEIPSLPNLRGYEIFWDELCRFCQSQQVTQLRIDTFGSEEAQIPHFEKEVQRKLRWEYVLNLAQPDFLDGLSSNHLRNIKRARKKGMFMRCASTPLACAEHAQLMDQSMERREQRGETVPRKGHQEVFHMLTQARAAEIFQAVLDQEVVSSILVLLCSQGAYYHTAGTSPRGMALGASHFLINEIARELSERSLQKFNLGGVDDPDGGLARFKSGFGSTRIALEAAEFFFGSRSQQWLGTASQWLKERCQMVTHAR